MIEPRQIADILGGQKTFHGPIRSLGELDRAVAKGLPKRALTEFMRSVQDARMRIAIAHHVAPRTTLMRRRTAFTRSESERLERIARVVATARYVWDDVTAAERWLNEPHPILGGRPIDVAAGELGARRCEDLLWQIFYGQPV